MPTMTQLRGLSVEVAQMFGMPHYGCRYSSPSVQSSRLVRGAECAWCGRHATNAHHTPPKGAGGKNRCYTMHTERGIFVLKPALIALCGSGTTGCHGAVHDGRLRIRWAWDEPEWMEDAWFTGQLLSTAPVAHDPQLYALGCWEMTDTTTEQSKLFGK